MRQHYVWRVKVTLVVITWHIAQIRTVRVRSDGKILNKKQSHNGIHEYESR